MKLLVGVLTCHRLDYYIDDLTVEYNKNRCLDQQARVNTQRATWLSQLPEGVDYKFFYGTRLRVAGNTNRYSKTQSQAQLRSPLPDEIFLDCGDGYTSNPQKLKLMCRYALEHGYDYLLRVDDDTFVYPDRLLATDWAAHDYSGAGHGDFHPGGCLFMSRRAMELYVAAPITTYADDVLLGNVMRDHRISVHELPIHNKWGDDYNVVPEKLPIHTLAGFHSCKPDAMRYLFDRR